jgi:hypothetical protein
MLGSDQVRRCYLFGGLEKDWLGAILSETWTSLAVAAD